MKMITRTRANIILITGLILILAAFFALPWGTASAQDEQPDGTSPSPLHPTFPLLDQNSENVLDTGNPVSTMQTCGACHDTAFIEGHSFHADVGYSEFGNPTSGRPWDYSPGWFGKWNPITYRYLTSPDDERPDLSLSEWIMTLGLRHVGGGPAEEPKLDSAWDWEQSGTVEMNCFLCHLQNPDNAARQEMLTTGQFQWASTAALGQGVVTVVDQGYTFNTEAFTPEGDLSLQYATIQDPDNENCGACHGLVHDSLTDPLVSPACDTETGTTNNWETQTTGQIISPQKLLNSGMNLSGKDTLDRSWDIHAERALVCTDCHFSLNNPVYYQTSAEDRPEHLLFDPRRLELGEYLYQPIHDFARGQSAQGTIAPELKGTMRRCGSCHDAEVSHDWLPYADKHFDAVACESCHIPQMYSTAYQTFDWTVLTTTGNANTTCRGIEGEGDTVNTLVNGFTPVLLPRQNVDGDIQLAPYNLITSWFWVYGEGDDTRPVRLEDLEAAWLENGDYPTEILAAFDANSDGKIDDAELVIDSPEKEKVIETRLVALGLENPRIQSEIQPYSINHTVAAGDWVTKDCQSCHGEDSKVTAPMLLSANVPGGVMPEFVKDANTITNGELYTTSDGALYYQPVTRESELYVLGHDSVGWIDWAGIIFFIGTVAGVSVHGGLRYQSRKNNHHGHMEIKQVYMYSVYERFWHWMQTGTILLLLITGLVIHKPETFGFLAFPHAVLVHNILAAILVINAALSLFYHLASGEIQQYIPRPYGFIDQAMEQAIFYLRGIFKGEAHPFEKTPKKKLNPLQQMVYFSILNVLLPLQVITGGMMWGAQRWPDIAASLGGLPFLAPFHSLISWLFASFIIMHVYLTTTGHTPTAAIKAMMLGWDEVEVPVSEEITDTLPTQTPGLAEGSAD